MILSSTVSCTSDEVNVPSDVIPKDKMIEIIYEMGLTEAAFRGRVYTDTLAEEKVRQRLMKTFTENGYSEAQFENSYEYYLENPKVLVDIYNEVLARYSVDLANTEKEQD